MLQQLAPGAVVADRYEIERLIGTGGMATVYRARHQFTGRVIALKMIHPALVCRKEMVDLFLKEARIGSTIGSSPHIVEVHDAGLDSALGAPFLAMELLEGETLQSLVSRVGPLAPNRVRALLSQLGLALDQAHDKRVVHRDLKTANLFVVLGPAQTEMLKVMDFGIAKVLLEEGQKTATHVGTPACAAPEQMGATLRKLAQRHGITIRSEISPATDVWALGLVAYEILTGHPAAQYWGAETLSELPIKAVLEDHVPASERAGERAALLPSGFDEWFARCLDKDSSGRWQRFSSAVENLVCLFDASPEAQPVRPPSPMAGTQLAIDTFVATPERPRAAAPEPAAPAPQAGTALAIDTFAPGQHPSEPAPAALPSEPPPPKPKRKRKTGPEPQSESSPAGIDTTLTSEETIPPPVVPRFGRKKIAFGVGALAVVGLIYLIVDYSSAVSNRDVCDSDQRRSTESCESACSWGAPKYCTMAADYENAKDAPNASLVFALARKACEGGDATGCARLGMLYDVGRGVEKNEAKAAELYLKACEGGDTDRCSQLAVMYDNGRGVAKDESRATAVLQKACDAKDRAACKSVAVRYETGKGASGQEARAAEMYQKLCDDGVMDMCLSLAVMLETGKGIAKDLPRAVGLFEKVCEGGNGNSCISLGQMYDRGDKVRQDEKRASQLYVKGCELAGKDGCHKMALSFTGLSEEKNSRGKIAILEKACDLGSGPSCGDLGQLFLTGKDKDLTRAAYLLQKSCDLKSSIDCNRLGQLYEKGEGVKLDLKKSTELFRKSCDQEDAWGCYGLAWALTWGRGVDKDEKRAFELARKSCDMKSDLGCAMVGALYYDGTGVEKDKDRGSGMMRDVCAKGEKWACTLLSDRGIPQR